MRHDELHGNEESPWEVFTDTDGCKSIRLRDDAELVPFTNTDGFTSYYARLKDKDDMDG